MIYIQWTNNEQGLPNSQHTQAARCCLQLVSGQALPRGSGPKRGKQRYHSRKRNCTGWPSQIISIHLMIAAWSAPLWFFCSFFSFNLRGWHLHRRAPEDSWSLADLCSLTQLDLNFKRIEKRCNVFAVPVKSAPRSGEPVATAQQPARGSTAFASFGTASGAVLPKSFCNIWATSTASSFQRYGGVPFQCTYIYISIPIYRNRNISDTHSTSYTHTYVKIHSTHWSLLRARVWNQAQESKQISQASVEQTRIATRVAMPVWLPICYHSAFWCFLLSEDLSRPPSLSKTPGLTKNSLQQLLSLLSMK